jgi:hypothetical protein
MQGFLLVFSIIDDQTLVDLKKILDLIKSSNPNKNIPIVLVSTPTPLTNKNTPLGWPHYDLDAGARSSRPSSPPTWNLPF